MKLAFAVSANYPKGIADTPGLLKTFLDSGVRSSLQIWDDPEVDWQSFDGVLLHTPWDYTNKYHEFIEWCEKVSKVSTLINDLDIVKTNSTKHYLLALQDKGVAIPRSRLLKAKQPIMPDELETFFEGRVVVKPLIDAGGERAKLFDTATEALPYVLELSNQGDVLVQEFVSEVLTQGEQSAIMIGGKLSHVVRKLPAPKEFRIDDELGGTIVPEKATRELEEFGLDILRKLNQSPLYARIDFIDSKTRLLMEAEMIEPQLFLRFAPESFQRLADGVIKAITGK